MSKHTPGPWAQFADTNVVIRLHSGEPRSEDLRICVVSTNTRRDEGAANVRLIVSAPELLAALRRMESAFDWFVGRSAFTQGGPLKGLIHSANVRKEVYAAHDEVRAAIAKATGEQS